MCSRSYSFPVLIAALLVGQLAAGQELHLKARTIHTVSTAASNGAHPKAHARAANTNRVHQIIQFDHLPGVADLEGLLAAGFQVVGAVPDNAVMVIASKAAAASTVTAAMPGVQWVGELETSDKMSPALATSGAAQGQEIAAIVEFHPDVEADMQRSIEAAEGVTFLHPAALVQNHMLVTASWDKLLAIAGHDEVAYIFPADPALAMGNAVGNEMIPCAGMLTAAGPVGQYA